MVPHNVNQYLIRDLVVAPNLLLLMSEVKHNRWAQVWAIGWVIDLFEAADPDGSLCHIAFVHRSIVLNGWSVLVG